jgi:lipopolysaccharide transport system ATP-binding protein
MHLRLAFAVAAHLEPDILFVDEVLAVGDAAFQRKCLGKIDEVSRHEGRTVLFVSHNMGVMMNLCPTVIWLDNGSIRRQGAVRDVINEYLAQGTKNQDQIVKLDSIARPNWFASDDRLRLESLEWRCKLPLQHGQPAKARIHFKINSPVSDIAVGLNLYTFDGVRLLSYQTDFPELFRPSFSEAGSYLAEIEIDSLPLAPDIYNLDIGCRSGDIHTLDYLSAPFPFEVVSGPTTPGYIIRKGAGALELCRSIFKKEEPRCSP